MAALMAFCTSGFRLLARVEVRRSCALRRHAPLVSACLHLLLDMHIASIPETTRRQVMPTLSREFASVRRKSKPAGNI